MKKRVFPSRTPEARRAQYLRNKATAQAWGERRKETLAYAKAVIRQATGVPVVEIPDELAEAKLAQIKALRVANDARRMSFRDDAVRLYKLGRTVRQIVEEIGYDRSIVAAMLLSHFGGLKTVARTHCARGHAFTPENTRTTAGGGKRCRKCACLNSAKSYENKKGLTPRNKRDTR